MCDVFGLMVVLCAEDFLHQCNRQHWSVVIPQCECIPSNWTSPSLPSLPHFSSSLYHNISILHYLLPHPPIVTSRNSGVETQVREGKCCVVYITPEKLLHWRSQLRDLAKRQHLTCIAVDEAHCVSEWVRLCAMPSLCSTWFPNMFLTKAPHHSTYTTLLHWLVCCSIALMCFCS